jgi:hypothetical protein
MILSSLVKVQVNITDNSNLDTTKLRFYINNNPINQEQFQFNITSGILSYLWNTELYRDGFYEIKVIAYDITGNRAERILTVQVNNGLSQIWRWLPWIFLIIGLIGILSTLYLLRRKGKLGIERLKD